MTDIFRVRVERKLLKDASRVAEEIGTTPGEVVRLLFAQLVKRRAVPFNLTADAPAADGLVDLQRRNQLLRDLDDSEGW
jgi:antitoxin component of RelBE/YafQ-DinJ toxin-antitoxin module